MKSQFSASTLCLLTLSAFLMGSSCFSAFGQDQKALQILEKMKSGIQAQKSLEASFSLTLKNPQGKVMEEKKGNFLLQGEKYRVDLGSQLIISDNKTLWVYLKEANEVQVSDVDPEQRGISPARLFGGFWDKDYEPSYRGSKTIDGKSCELVELHSTSSSAPFSRVQLTVTKEEHRLVSGQFVDQSGGSFEYRILQYKPNIKTQASQFQFQEKDHPGVEVIDLR